MDYNIHLEWCSPIAILAYFLVCSGVSSLCLRPLVPLVSQKEGYEGLFRSFHNRLSHFAISIAGQSGYPDENLSLVSFFNRLIQVQIRVAWWTWPVKSIATFQDYFGALLSYIIIAIPFYRGAYSDKTASELSAGRHASLTS